MIFSIYKRSQGKYTRLCSAFGFGIIVGFGCYQLYNTLQAVSWGFEDENIPLWINTMVPAVLFVVLCFLIFWLVNKPSVADFLIAGEGEMKKVSWSSRKEIAVSTFIVVVVVVALALFLGFVDMSFRLFFNDVIGI